MSYLQAKQIGIITQARMTSSRMPGKIMKEIEGKTLLHYHLERLRQSGFDIVIATTTNAHDDAIEKYSKLNNLPFHRGSEHDVLARFYETQQKFGYDIMVRVTSDCPLIDASLIKKGIDIFLEKQNENLYVSNCFPRTYSRGFDFEIFSAKQLASAFQNATEDFDREHVTPYFWKNKSGEIEMMNISQANDNSHLRVCVDVQEDFDLIGKLITKHNAHHLSFSQIENLLNSNNDLVQLNAHIEQKKN